MKYDFFFSGRTYFFKGRGFWKLNDIRMRAENENPIPSAAFWMNCSNYDQDHHPSKSKYSKKWENEEKITQPSSSTLFAPNVFSLVLLLLYNLLLK